MSAAEIVCPAKTGVPLSTKAPNVGNVVISGVHPLYFSVRNVIFGLGWRSRWIWVANQSKR